MKTAGTYSSTLIILCAKHGQSPIDPTTLKKIPTAALQNATNVKFAHVTADDVALIWLEDPTTANVNQAKKDLLSASSKTGVARILAGSEVYMHGFGDPRLDPRVPDLVITVIPGVIYTTSTSKVMEHGGTNPDDLTTALFVHNPNIVAEKVTERVYTRQIAVTALEALGAPVSELDGAQADGTVGLPGLGL